MLFSSRGLQQSRRFYGLLEGELYGRVRSSNQEADRELVLGVFLRANGCFAPGEWMPNTSIVTDPRYRILNATTLEIQYGEGWHRFTKCTTDTNPPLDYATMAAASHEPEGSIAPHSEPIPETTSVQSQEDPHRPACTNESCKQIEAFLKKHYCGSPRPGTVRKLRPSGPSKTQFRRHGHCGLRLRVE